MRRRLLLSALSVFATHFGAGAQTAPAPADHTAHHAQSDSAKDASAQEMTEGEIRKVDKQAGKLTIKHGPIANLEMPAMTMVFRAADPKMLNRVKAGDKVRFVARAEGGQLTVTRIDVVKGP